MISDEPLPTRYDTSAEDPVEYATREAIVNLREAAALAPKIWPGPVGEYISHELRVWDDYGFRIGGHRDMYRLVDYIVEQGQALEQSDAA